MASPASPVGFAALQTGPTAGGPASAGRTGPPPAASFLLRVHSRMDELPHPDVLDRLATRALERNPFLEPWLLLPALEAFGRPDLQLVIVERVPHGAPASQREVTGFFPFERSRGVLGLPVRVLRLWRHRHCFLTTPLLHADHAAETLAVLLRWLREGTDCGLAELRGVSGDGAFSRALFDAIAKADAMVYSVSRRGRALFVPKGEQLEQYLRTALRGRHVKELRRKRRRLEEKGTLSCRVFGTEDDRPIDEWIERFLTLEQAGWKGAERTALGSSAEDRRFFAAAARAAAARGQLMMLSLELDGRPIAMKCNFTAGNGGFAFKIAYDEAYADYSPGMQLELENMKHIVSSATLDWMDSCANPDHFMIGRLWKERRTLETLLVSAGRPSGDVALALIPALRVAGRLWRRVRPVVGVEDSMPE